MDYQSLRDKTAGALIAASGRPAILRQQGSSSYDPATGKNTIVTRDTVVQVIESALKRAIKGREGMNQFESEQVKHWDASLIMSAKETAAAGVEPVVGDQIVLDGQTFKIAWLEPVSPGGVAVIYKMAISK
jgi:hypothetical protein